MNSPEIVAALREHVPEAPGELYDSQADSLYQYCWLMLRNRETAQVAVRDAIVAGEAHIGRLADPELLRPWLFALARVECGRRPAAPPGETDEPIARPQQPDADLRVMAWNSVMSLEPAEREALDLVSRHRMGAGEVALVLDTAPSDIRELLEAARQHLEQALAAEILVARPSHECAGRTDAMHGWAGTVTPETRERLLRHGGLCPVCLPHLPRNVSAARVFSLIPRPALTRAARARVLTCFSDPQLAGYRTFAAARLAAFDAAGFPVPGPVPDLPASGYGAEAGVTAGTGAGVASGAGSRSGTGGGSRNRGGRGSRTEGERGSRAGGERGGGKRLFAGLGAAAAAAAAGIAAAFVFGGLGGNGVLNGGTQALSAGGRASQVAGAEPGLPGATRTAVGDSIRRPDPGNSGAAASHGPSVAGHGLAVPASASAAIPIVVPPLLPQRGVSATPLPGLPGSTIPYQSPTPSPSQSGQLQVSKSSLSLGTRSRGRIVLTNAGGSVSWTAGPSGNVTLSETSGQLSTGQSVTLVITVTRQNGAAGDATVTFDPGATSVAITWAATASSPPPPTGSPPPSPSWSPRPSRSPHPSPSPSPPSSPSVPPSPSPSPSAGPSASGTPSASRSASSRR
jgi:DNA-directed RNA polymerase specialized sigma24 family protein